MMIGCTLLANGVMSKPLCLEVSRPDYETIVKALEKAREIHQKEPSREVVITLPSGYTTLTEPIVLRAEDSNLTLQGNPRGKTILGSGRTIRNWRRLEGSLWAADLPEVKTGQWDFRTLIVNGKWRRRSFLPRRGFFEHLSEYKEPWRSTTGGGFGNVPEELRRMMTYKPEDLGGWLSSANAELVIYHSWDTSHARIEAHDVARHILTLTPPLGYPAGAFGIHRYRVENIAQGMHTPGLWYLDREKGRLVYWALPDENMERAIVMAPVGTTLIKIEGTAETPVRNVRLVNFTLQDTNVSWKSPGFGAGGITETAVVVSHARNCTFERLQFRFLGGNAIRIWAGSDNRLAHCEIGYLGASGVIATGAGEMGIGDNLTIEDNHVHDVGLLYPSAIAVRISNVAQARICRNLIHDVAYSGLAYDGDFKHPRAVNGLIENNHIYRVMTGLDDGAGIYVSGLMDGLLISGNVCHDIHGLTGTGRGIYPDEQSRFITVRGNLVYRCNESFLCHMAHDIRFANNISVHANECHIRLGRSEKISFVRNIFLSCGEPIFHANVSQPKTQFAEADYNLYWDRSGQRPSLGKISWEDWLGLGFDTHALFTDPLFADSAHDRYELRPNSPAFRLGFERLELSRVPH